MKLATTTCLRIKILPNLIRQKSFHLKSFPRKNLPRNRRFPSLTAEATAAISVHGALASVRNGNHGCPKQTASLLSYPTSTQVLKSSLQFHFSATVRFREIKMDRIDLLEAYQELRQGLEKLVRVTENPRSEEGFTADEHIRLYTIVYDLCTMNAISTEMEKTMYNCFAETVEDYLSRTVLPPLKLLQGDELAEQFVSKWAVYKDVYGKVSHIFNYVHRSFMERGILDPAKHRSQLFYDQIFKETHEQVAAAAIAMITRFREGKEINVILLRQIFAVIVEIGDGTLNYYEQYFEGIFLAQTLDYYYLKATDWGYTDTNDLYKIKVAQSITMEEDIGCLFLCESTCPKLRQTVQNAFRAATENVIHQLFTKGLRLRRAPGSEGDN